MNRRQLLISGGGFVALGAAQMGSASDYADATDAMRLPLAADPDVREYIRLATLAPNGHNSQPWQFSVAPGRITIAPDRSRRAPVVDPDDHHLFNSLGSAAENLTLAAAARGTHGQAMIPQTVAQSASRMNPAPPHPRRCSMPFPIASRPAPTMMVDRLARAISTCSPPLLPPPGSTSSC